MKTLLKILILLISTSMLQGAFWELKPGAKAARYGYAYTAVGRDADAVYYNPSRLVFADKINFSGGYERLYAGLDQDSLHFQSLFFALPENEIGAFGAGTTYFTGNFYKESISYLSYAKSLPYDWSAGISFKYLRKRINTAYSQDIALDPFFSLNGTAVSNYSFDLGLNWQKKDLALSLSAKNLTQPDMAYQDSVTDRLPLSISVAAAQKSYYLLPWLFSAEIEYTGHKINETLDGLWYAAGVEAQLIENQLAISAGFNKNMLSGGLSFYGFSWSKITGGIDYSVSLPFSLTGESLPIGLLSHRFGFNLAFGGNPNVPSADDSRWQKTIPERYTLNYLDNNRRQNLILWVKDQSGNINHTETEITADTKPPVVESVDFHFNSSQAILKFKGEGLDYFRISDGSIQSEWQSIQSENLINLYRSGEVNYLQYEVKDLAGNIAAGSLLINGNNLILNQNDYPLLNKMELVNPHTNRVAACFKSDSLILKCSASGKPAQIEYTIDNLSAVKAAYRDKISIPLAGLSGSAKHRIRVRVIRKESFSNYLNLLFTIDDNRPNCLFKFNGSKKGKNQPVTGTVLDPGLTINQSTDVTDWLLTLDTLKWQESRWLAQKPAKYQFAPESRFPAQLFLRVRDEAGNLSNWSKAQFYYDNRLPVFRQLSLDKNLEDGIYIFDKLTFSPKIEIENAEKLEILINGQVLSSAEIQDAKPQWKKLPEIPVGVEVGELVFKITNAGGQSTAKNLKFKVIPDKNIGSNLSVKLYDLKTGISEVTGSAEIAISVFGTSEYTDLLLSDNPEFENADKISYQNLFRYRLKGADGIRYLFCKAIGADGGESLPVISVIKLDTQAPTGTFRITSTNGKVDLSKVEIIYSNLSTDITGYYLTENREDIPPLNSPKWQTRAPNFYNFNSKNDGSKTVYLYLTDRAGNVSQAVKETVLLTKFLNDSEKEEQQKNRRLPNVSLEISDRSSGYNKVSGSDSVRVGIKSDKELTGWLLTEKEIEGAIKGDEWLTSEPQYYFFKTAGSSRKQLNLYAKDINGLVTELPSADSIRLNILEPALLNIRSADSTTLDKAALPIYLDFNKMLDKSVPEELTVLCISNKSGVHQVDIQIKDKTMIIAPAGIFQAGEQLSCWAFGYYRDETKRRYYLDKRWSVTLKSVQAEPGVELINIDSKNRSAILKFKNTGSLKITQYKLAQPEQFSTALKQPYQDEMLYLFPADLIDGEYKLQAQFFSEKGESKVMETMLYLDRKKPAVQLFVKGRNSSSNGITSGTEIDLDIRGDQDIREFLIEELP